MKRKMKMYSVCLASALFAACLSDVSSQAVSHTAGFTMDMCNEDGTVAVKRILTNEKRLELEQSEDEETRDLLQWFNPARPFMILDSDDFSNMEENGQPTDKPDWIVLDSSNPWALDMPRASWGKKIWKGSLVDEWEEPKWPAEHVNTRELASDNTWKKSEMEKSYQVPEGPETITYRDLFYMEGFDDNTTELILPDSLRKIPDRAFQFWLYLRDVTIPSGVTEIGEAPFDTCVNLRTVNNQSGQTVSLPTSARLSGLTQGSKEYGYDYYVDGERVTEVPAGKTAVAKGRVFSLKYDLNGGKMSGERARYYRVGENTKLPGAKRKGYTFLGWSIGKDPQTWFTLYDEDSNITGDKKLVARWKKITAKRTGKTKMRITVTNRAYEDVCPIACLYATKKNMKDSKIIYLSRSYTNPAVTKKKNTIKEVEKNYTNMISKKKKTVTCDLKNLKKGKTYYLQFKRIGDSYGGYYVGKKVLKTIKVKLK